MDDVRRLVAIAIAALCAALLVGPVAAAPGAQVPAFSLKRIQAKAGDASYLPTRLPFGYRYERWQLPSGKLVVTFKHKNSADRFTFQVERLPQGMECDLQGSFLRTLQMDGNKVYYSARRASGSPGAASPHRRRTRDTCSASTRAGLYPTLPSRASPHPASASPACRARERFVAVGDERGVASTSAAPSQ